MGIWETHYQTLLWRWFDLYVAIMITIIIYYNTILIKIKLAAVNDNFSNNDNNDNKDMCSCAPSLACCRKHTSLTAASPPTFSDCHTQQSQKHLQIHLLKKYNHTIYGIYLWMNTSTYTVYIIHQYENDDEKSLLEIFAHRIF